MEKVLEKLTVLVAEDDKPSLELALTLLKHAGAHARGVADGKSAVDRATTEPFDVILMDLQMPVMDGFAATRTIRTHQAEAARGPLIIGVTANTLPEHTARCLACGMDAVIPKPIDPASFAQTIRRYVDGAR